MSKQRKCLNPKCVQDDIARGLCHNCYGIAARLVREGRVSWEELEANGKAFPRSTKRNASGGTTTWLLGVEEIPRSTKQ